MNNSRRKRINQLSEQLSSLTDDLNEILENEILDEESEYRDNIPENMCESERYEQSDSDCDSLSNAIDSINEACESLGEIE